MSGGSVECRLKMLHEQCAKEQGMKVEEFVEGEKLVFSWIDMRKQRVTCAITTNPDQHQFNVLHHPLLPHLTDAEQLLNAAHDLSHMRIKRLINNVRKYRSYALHHPRNGGNDDVKSEEPLTSGPLASGSSNEEDISLIQQMLAHRPTSLDMNGVKDCLRTWGRKIQNNYIIRRCMRVLGAINSIEIYQEPIKHADHVQANVFNLGISILFQQDPNLEMKVTFYEEGRNISYTYHICDTSSNHEQIFLHSQHDIEQFLNIETIGGKLEDIGRKICVIQSRLCYIPLHQHLVQSTVGRSRVRGNECDIEELPDCMKIFCRKASFQLNAFQQPPQWTIKLELKKLNFGNNDPAEEIDFRSTQLYPTSACVQNYLRIMSDIMNLYRPVQEFSSQMAWEEHSILRHLFQVDAYDFNTLTIKYFASSYRVRIGCNSSSRRLIVNFPKVEEEVEGEDNPHKRMEEILEAQLNRSRNILSLVYTLVYTCAPLLSIRRLEKGYFATESRTDGVEKQFKLFFVDTHHFQLFLYNRFNLSISCSGVNSIHIRDLHSNYTPNQLIFRKMLPVPRLTEFIGILRHVSPESRSRAQPPPSDLTLSHQEFDNLCTPNPNQSYLEKYLLAALNLNSIVSALRFHKHVFNELPLAVFAAVQEQGARPLLSLYEFGFALKHISAPRCLFFLDAKSPAQLLKFRCFPGCSNPLQHTFKNVDCRILEYFINSALLQRQIFRMSAVKSITEMLRCDPLIMIDLVHIIRLQLLTSRDHDPHTAYRWSVKLLLTAPISINNILQGHQGVSVTSKRVTVFIELTENCERGDAIKFVVCMRRCDPYGPVQLFGAPHSLPYNTVDVLKFKSMKIIEDFHKYYQVPRPLLLFYSLAYLVNHLSLD